MIRRHSRLCESGFNSSNWKEFARRAPIASLIYTHSKQISGTALRCAFNKENDEKRGRDDSKDGRFSVFLESEWRFNRPFVLQDELLCYIIALLGKLSIRPVFNFPVSHKTTQLSISWWTRDHMRMLKIIFIFYRKNSINAVLWLNLLITRCASMFWVCAWGLAPVAS